MFAAGNEERNLIKCGLIN